MALSTFITRSKPIGLSWRSHYWYTTAVIGVGISTDILIYSVLIPVLPFRLEQLGYDSVPALVGYMLFAFSGGLVISTLPIAWYSENYSSRRTPLNVGMVVMIGSQSSHGISSSMIWIAGLALVCDMTPPEHTGRQLGFVMAGFSVGLLLGPAVGGALYDKFGWHGPLIFGVIVLAVDLVGRLLIIDRTAALKYGVDPKATSVPQAASTLSDEKLDVEANSSTRTPTVAHIEQNTSEQATVAKSKQLSLLSVVIQMGKSPRALAPLLCSLVYGLVLAMEETTVPLHLKDVWDLNSTKVGLIFLAGAIPPLFGAPLAGWLSDKWGTEWTLPMSLLLAVPWWCVLIVEKSLALFIVAATLQMFFTSSVSAPIMTELAGASDDIEGVGYAHVYGAFNLIYGVGSAVGPIIGGQIYDHISKGWLIVCIIGAATMFVAVVLTGCFSGDAPLLLRLKRLQAREKNKKDVVDGQT